MSSLHVKPEQTAERMEFYDRLKQKGVGPLWESLADLVPPQPRPAAVPMHWSYEAIRPLLLEAGSVITAKQAERRVLMLENPGIQGGCLITESLYAGLQMVLPGEIARTHRHTASALRFVIEGAGAYTAVEGERAYMRPGDFILTPSWTYHDHANPSQEPIVWLDGLDVPIVNLLNTGFAEPYGEETQPQGRRETDSLKRYGSNMAPVKSKHQSLAAPVFTYPYDRSREALEWLSRADAVDECDGFKMRYINPSTGGYPLPTIAAFLQMLPRGFRGSKYRSTESTVFSVVEGRGRSHIGNRSFAWKERDIFVAPSWYPVSHESEADSVLFSFSDRPVQQALGLWREEAPLVRG
jgi:gentisate 1,2-dioxygenase